MSELTENPPERIMGAEFEWTICDTRKNYEYTHWLSGYHPLYDFPFEGVVSPTHPKDKSRSTNSFLSNGMRWYLDTDHNAETATPECLGFDQVTTYVIASDRFIAKALASHTTSDSIRTHRRVATYEGNPKGFHENYSVRKPEDWTYNQIAEQLVGFLIARSLFNGAGYVDVVESEPVIMPAQKARYVGTACTSATTNDKDKTWIVDRNERFNDTDPALIRLQVAGGDANISPWATRFTFATTSIVLRLIENGISLSQLQPVNLQAATQRAAQDYRGEASFMVNSAGRNLTMRLIDVLEAHLELALKYKDSGIFSPDEYRFLDEWEQAITDFRLDKSSLADCVDWLTKAKLLEEYRSTHSDLTLEQAMGFDLMYDAITGFNNPIGERLRQAGYYRVSPSEEEIEQATYQAPMGTRAHHRAELIRALSRLKLASRRKSVNWDIVELGNINECETLNPNLMVRKNLFVKLNDPYGHLDDEALAKKEELLSFAA